MTAALKPSVIPRWAETVAGVGAANIVAPSSGQLDTGWTATQVGVSSYENWFKRYTGQWLQYLRDAAFTATAASGLPGVSGVGDGAAAGAVFTGGATNGAGATGQGVGTGVGLKGTGGATGLGGAFVAGGGATPARGAINLAPVTSAPSAPSNGDIWMDATSLSARVAGASVNFAQCSAFYKRPTLMTVVATGFTVINFDTSVYDTDAAVTTGAAWVFTCPAGKAGKYRVSVGMAFNTSQATQDGLLVRYGTALASSIWLMQTPAINKQMMQGSVTVALAVGDQIQASVDNGGVATNLVNDGPSNWICIERVST